MADRAAALEREAEGSGRARPCVDVLIPAYNEEAVLEANVVELLAHIAAQGSFSWRVVVVDDGSSDRTGEIAARLARENPDFVVLRHPRNLGLGAALRTGFAHARGDALVVLDADLSYAPSIIGHLLDALFGSDADIATASPYAAGGRASHVPLLRLALSRGANMLLSASLGGALSTPTAMVRAYSRRAYRSLALRATGMDANLEIVAQALRGGLRMVEVPAQLRWRGSRQERALRSRRQTPGAMVRQTLAVLGWSVRLIEARAARPSVARDSQGRR